MKSWTPFNIKALNGVLPWALAILSGKAINDNNHLWTFIHQVTTLKVSERLHWLSIKHFTFSMLSIIYYNNKSHSFVKTSLIVTTVNLNQNTLKYQSLLRTKERKPLQNDKLSKKLN